MSKRKWDWFDIKSELHRRGMTLTALAELNGLDKTACRQVKSKTNRKAEAAIADFLGERVEDLFPDRYPIQKSHILSSEYAEAIASQKGLKDLTGLRRDAGNPVSNLKHR